MTYNEFMERPQRLRKRILHKADEVAFKLEICRKTTGTMGERVQTSPGNVTEIHYADYIDANNNLKSMVDDYNHVTGEVINFLYDNLDFDDADILEWRYISNKSVKDISKLVGVAYQTAKNKMSKAEKTAEAKFYEISTK